MKPHIDFDSVQQQAIALWDQCLLVSSSVGSGKTEVLSARLAYAIEKGVRPEYAFTVSFTNKAAANMRRRIEERLGSSDKAGRVVVTTFHGLCASLLRLESEELGISPHFSIMDDDDARDFLLRSAEHLGVRYPKRIRRKLAIAIHTFIEKVTLQEINSYCDAEPISNPITLSDECFIKELESFNLSDLNRNQSFHIERLAQSYRAMKQRTDSLDFADLSHLALTLILENDIVRERWQSKCQWVQVDEMQDTSYYEYTLLKLLSHHHQHLSLFGDFNQTIYEWRGSVPTKVIAAFKSDFAPVYELHFKNNYRCKRPIRDAIRTLTTYASSDPIVNPEEPAEEHEENHDTPIMIHEFLTARDEYIWIGNEIKRLQESGGEAISDIKEMAILVRTNYLGADISNVLTEMNIPHLLLDEFKFLKRKEIKDILALLRVLINPLDQYSLKRILLHFPFGISGSILNDLRSKIAPLGLRLSDFINETTLQTLSPFEPALSKLKHGEAIILDTETTGLNPSMDEILEIAGVRVKWDGTHLHIIERFERLLRHTTPFSSSIHAITEDDIARDGQEPAEALKDFRDFCADHLLIGHNCKFDISFLNMSFQRYGLSEFDSNIMLDTCDVAKRFVRLHNYRLSTLSTHFSLPIEPTHRAMPDVLATHGLLCCLIPYIERGNEERAEVISTYRPTFEPLANQISQWRHAATRMRSDELLEHLYHESGIWEYYLRKSRHLSDIEKMEADYAPIEEIEAVIAASFQESSQDTGESEPEITSIPILKDPKASARLGHLKELQFFFRRKENRTCSPFDALSQLLTLTALNDNYRESGRELGTVYLLTVHQAKGLEFDAVFIAGANDRNFPTRRNTTPNALIEEKRLFYVAMSRAKERLYITYATTGEERKKQVQANPSPYLKDFPDHTYTFLRHRQ